jgi:hypothetical protein
LGAGSLKGGCLIGFRRGAAVFLIGWMVSVAVAQESSEGVSTDSTRTDAVGQTGVGDSNEPDDVDKPSDSSDRDTVGEAISSEPASPARPVLRLPPALPDGRPLRPIALFESQMDELVPDDYRPVSIDQLQDAIARLTDRATDDRASRLRSAVYWVKVRNGSLISNRSVIDIASDRPTVVRRSLGKVNLAIENPQGRNSDLSLDSLPRLESDPDGNLVAVFRGDSVDGGGIEFQWKLDGRLAGSGHEYKLELPRTPQTRIVLSAPEDLVIEALDGVLRSRPGPPPDASGFSSEGERWYEIDAGGLSTVRLRTRAQETEVDRGRFVLRRSSIQYEVDAAGLSWTSRMVVQPPTDPRLPPLQIDGTTLTSVKVNGTDIPFTSKIVSGSIQNVLLELPAGLIGPQTADVNLTVTGYSTWAAKSGWCDLPRPSWAGEGMVQASAVDEVQLAVLDPLRVMAWELPPDWKQSQPQRSNAGVTLFSADGPPIDSQQGSMQADQASRDQFETGSDRPAVASESGSAAPVWSRVRLSRVPDLLASDTTLKLEIASGLLTASARLVVTLDPTRVEPLRLEVEPDWTLESVTFVRSGRVVEYAGLSEQRRTLELWPEAEDADGGRIVIEASGSRAIPAVTGGLVIPSTWFARVTDVRGRMLAAIVPPAELNWSGEAAMQRGRIKSPDLTPEQEEFLGVVSPETLWFQPDTARTPPVQLRTPSVSYNASSLLELALDDGDVIERLVVGVESQSQNLKELVIQTGPAAGRPDFVWSIKSTDEGSAINLPSSDVTVGRGEDDGVYTIDVTDTSLRARHLIAQRRYRADSEIQLQLPSVPGAASQDSDVLIDADLVVKQHPSSVQLVPVSPESLEAVQPGELRLLFDGESIAASGSSRGWTRLRYDAVEQPTVVLGRLGEDPAVTIVWREQVRMTASSRGTDRIEATYLLSPAAPFRIETDAELRLVSLSRDGEPVELNSLRQRPIVLQSRFKTEEIQVVWDRSQFGASWLRRCRMPRVRVSGTVLRSEYSLASASDSFTPAALLSGTITGDSIDLRPGESVVLLRRNTVLALGWFLTILVFAGAWYVAERSPATVAALLILIIAVLFLWWPWRLAVIGWLIVPLVAAAMLSTARARSRGKAGLSNSRETGSGESEGRESGGRESGGREFGAGRSSSLDGPSADYLAARPSVIWFALLVGGGVMTAAQEPASPVTPEPKSSVNVLVPVTESGELYGQTVYIPQSTFVELFRAGANNTPREASFQSANYRVRINPSIALGDQSIFTGVEVEYRIRIDRGDLNANLVRLPLQATNVRRLERIDEVSRIVPFEADSSGRVLASLPRGDSFQLRATLRPTVSQSDQWTRLNLAIPPVASSRLSVESEQNVDAIRVGGTAGRLLAEQEELLRSWEAEIGPTPRLEIDVRVSGEGSRSETRALGRRYWIHAGKRQVTIDCEVDPPNSLAAGEPFQFVVRDSAMPALVSSAWQFRGSELYSPTRRLMTVESTRDSPGPIRLLWTQPLDLDRGDQSVEIRIPEVIAAALGENADAWIALHCDTALQFAPLMRETIEPLSVDQFLAAWSGHRGRIDRAFVPIGEIPTPILEVQPATAPRLEQSHHLHVMPESMELFYSATLTPSDFYRSLYRLQVPESLELTRISVNGIELVDRTEVTHGSGEFLLGDFVGTEPIKVEAIAVLANGPGKRFTPPRLSILPNAFTVDEYRISRDRATKLAVVREPAVEPTSANELAMADSLDRGWIPVASWSSESERSLTADQLPGGLFEVQVQPTRFDCDQLIALSRVESQWVMETFVHFAGRIPDFVDIEVPTSWCENLEVSPVTALSRQPATDPSRQVIRIRCDRTELVDNILSIRGNLIDGEMGRVGVPSVRVLGFGNRRIHVSVPNRLANDPVQWRTSAVEGERLPRRWQSKVGQAARSTYVVANPSWSIDLAPLPDIDAQATAISFDAQVFPQADGVLVMCHWDLFPGSLEQIDVQLPIGASCIGAWSAGKAVLAELQSEPSPTQPEQGMESDQLSESSRLLRVPLALSRFFQPIELLIHVPASAAKQGDYLPGLVAVPVQQSWLTTYNTDDSNSIWDDASKPSEERALALAESVLDGMDAVGFIDRRPRDEVVAWLQLWFARYRMIAESVGHPVSFDTDGDAESAGPTALPLVGDSVSEDEIRLTNPLRWKRLDARMAAYVNRFLSDSSIRSLSDPSSGMFLFGVAGFRGFHTGLVRELDATQSPPSVLPISQGDQGIRSLIINALTLVLLGGLLICLRPMRRMISPVVNHPAFWIGMMGLFGFAVAPIPVAAALILVSVALPVFPARRG